MEPAASAGPRVYVPIVHPDSSAPTYAVLQFLGFSPPPDPPHPCLLNPNFPPTIMTPRTPPQHLPCLSPLAGTPPPFPTPTSTSTSSPSSPPHTSSRSSSNRNEKEKKFTSIIKPPPMKKSGAASTAPPAAALSPSPRRGSVKGPVATSISICHTEKDTIIHTHSSNFREVVHQLTGAASGNRDMMPVTMPARAINRYGGANQGNVKEDIPISPMASTIITPGSTQRAATTTTKLLERRKSAKVLQRLSTSCRDLPPLVPSPVTPLASDFEKICLPVTTPTTTSQSSSTTATAAAIASASILSSNEGKAMEVGSEEGKSMDKGSSLSHAMDMDCDSYHAMEMGSCSTHGMGKWSDSTHAEELAIAKKGFFLHSQRPRHGDPTLLHLFPESPREQ